MEASELDFDLNNPVEVAEDDIWDVLGFDPIGGASDLSNDDYEDENLADESVCLFCKVQTTIATIQKYLEQHTSDVGKSVGIKQQIEKQLSLVHAIESHQTTIDSYFSH